MDLNIVVTSIEKVKITKNTTAVVYIDCALSAQDMARAEERLAAKFGCKIIVMDKRMQAYFIAGKPAKAPKPDKPTPQWNSYGEFKNVRLTAEEHEKLIEKAGKEADANRAIEELSAYMVSKNRRYANHYATLLNWIKRYPKAPPPAGSVFDRIDEALSGGGL